VKNDFISARQEILSLLSSRPNEDFYINELIRITGRYPNSIQTALKKLTKDQLITSTSVGNKKFYRISKKAGMEVKQYLPPDTSFNWIKVINREGAYAFSMTVCLSNRDQLKKLYNTSMPTYWYNSLTHGLYYNSSELNSLGMNIAQKLERDSTFAQKDIALCTKLCNTLLQEAKRIPNLNLTKLNNSELKSILEKFYRMYMMLFPFLTSPFAIERYFEQKIRERVSDERQLETLLSPISTVDQEMIDVLNLASHIKQHGMDAEFEKKLTDHWQTYCWLTMFSINANPLPRDYFLNEAKNILEKIPNSEEEANKLKNEDKKRQQMLKNTLQEMNARTTLKQQVYFLQKYITLRTFRKNIICQSHYYHMPLLYEIASRLELSNVDIKFLTYEEILHGLSGQKSHNELKKRAKARQSGWAVLVWQEKISEITCTAKILKAMEQYRIVQPQKARAKLIQGTIACRGKIVGRVKIIHKISELGKIEKGDILVTKMTTPDFVVAMSRCGGIVTDEGGVTCHAAIVSREMNVPCLIATGHATSTLKDNDIVELDAHSGVVRMIETTITDAKVKQIHGKGIYAGKITGRAVVVRDVSDFPKVQKGDILITSQTTPDYLSCLYRINGLIVDEDSITSHAVLYAKALKIPTIMGTRNARDIIMDGEKIELDATNGVVTRKIASQGLALRS